ncbi:hypothetical protein BDV93DRAFT_525850 [Ceratobasidium sp. AG-I]|nr:hypothetical protein BDV93DRAFT_525850 [Ceratobasidium sp. AG-I]
MSAMGERNNQNRVPAPDNSLNNLSAQTYTRDPRSYYDDGNVVFLVGEVLFKLHKFLILSHMTTEVGEPVVITRSDIELRRRGMSDRDPFVVRVASAQQFC